MSTLWLIVCSALCVAGFGVFALGCWAIADHQRHGHDRDDGLIGDRAETQELPRYRGTRRRPWTGAVHPPASRTGRLRRALTSRTGWVQTERGSRPEPPLNPRWSALAKLQWAASLARTCKCCRCGATTTREDPK